MQLREINAIWSCSLWTALWNVFVCGVLLLLTVRRVNRSFDIRLGDAADAPWEWISKRNRVSLCPSGIVTIPLSVSVPSNQLDSTPLDTIWTNARLRFHRQTQTAYHMSAQYRHGPLKWNVRSTSCPLQKSLPYPVWEIQQEPNLWSSNRNMWCCPIYQYKTIFISENHFLARVLWCETL